MYCAYHTSARAKVQCTTCARSLCTACDHRIKGYPYCQDCIVLGIESLSRAHRTGPRSKAKARLAALCGIFPGLGAVYNRQNFKAIAHFVGTVGLFQLGHIPRLGPFFGLAGMAFYFYSIIDAYRTAQLIGDGVRPEEDEARFKRQLAKRAPVFGVALILTGVLIIIQLMHPFGFLTPARVLPAGLILLGGYLLTRYFKRSDGRSDSVEYPRRPPYPLIPDSFANQAPSNVRPMYRSGDRR